MQSTFRLQRRPLQLAALTLCVSGLCVIVGCNSNDTGGHHMVLTDFGTGQLSDTLYPRTDVSTDQLFAATTPAAKPAPAHKPAAEKPVAQAAVKEEPAVEKAAVKESTPEAAAPVTETVTEEPAKEEPAVEEPAAEEPAAPAEEPQPVVAEKPAPKATEVALAPKPAPTPAPADEKTDAEGRPELPKGTGGFSGVVTFEGTAPAPKELYAKGAAPKDPAVCGAVAIPDQSLMVNQENNGVKDVFVYLRKKPKSYKGKAPKDPIIFDQKHCIFLPHNLIVFAGQEVLVKNGDPIVHNTHTNPVRNPGFNSAIGADDRVGVKLLYRRAETLPVKVQCDLHAWMSAYHLVLDHPFCASTDENGKFAIAGLPPGDYEFTIWQETPGYLEKSLKVTVKAGEYTEKPLSYKAKDFAQHVGPEPKVLVLNGID